MVFDCKKIRVMLSANKKREPFRALRFFHGLNIAHLSTPYGALFEFFNNFSLKN